jgi:hypothetical protein
LLQLHDAPEPGAELTQTLNELLYNEQRRTAIGERARLVCETNRGATNRTLELLLPVLDSRIAPPYEPAVSTIQAVTAK